MPQLLGSNEAGKDGDTIINAVVVKEDGTLFFGGSTDSKAITGESTKVMRPVFRYRRETSVDSGDDSQWIIKNAGSYNWKEVTSIVETSDGQYPTQNNRFFAVIRSHTANAQ